MTAARTLLPFAHAAIADAASAGRRGTLLPRCSRCRRSGRSSASIWLEPKLYFRGETSHDNPVLKAFADRLRGAGKPHKVVITGVARKPVTINSALVKSGQNRSSQTA